MVNIIWGIFIVAGIVYGLLSGNIRAINDILISSGKTSIEIIMEMIPVLVIWMGLMEIADKSGLLTLISKKISKVLGILFPTIPKDNPSLGYIASNVAVNMAGLGSAATPFGLKAMEELQKINDKKDTASDAMITFLVLNTGGVTIIPTTIIALRALHKSANPNEIIITCILATFISCMCGLLLDYFIRRKNRGNR